MTNTPDSFNPHSELPGPPPPARNERSNEVSTDRRGSEVSLLASIAEKCIGLVGELKLSTRWTGICSYFTRFVVVS